VLTRRLSAAEFRDAYALLFEGRGSLHDCVIHVRGMDQRTLKKAYRRRAHDTHPDRAHLQPKVCPDPDAAFRAVVAAYELLRLVQQGDLDVAVAVTRDAARRASARPAAKPRPSTSAPRDTAQQKARASAGHAEGEAERARSRARAERRQHRNERPFSAGSDYQRWQGRADEKTTRDAPEWGAHRARDGAQPRPGSRRPVEAGDLLPQRSLQLGQYLYYTGMVSWRQLIDALVWQRRQRPLIGQLALAWGLLSRDQINDVLQRRRLQGRLSTPFAEFALECGYLTPSQHRALCARAQLMQQRLGRYFVEQGILSEEHLGHCLRAMRLHNWRVKRRAQAHG
jgi:hypothetical protein